MRARLEKLNQLTVALAVWALVAGPAVGFAQTQVVAEARDVILENGSTLRGVVTDRAGNPVPNTTVRVLSNGAEIASLQSDSAGRFQVDGMREGEHVVEGAGNSVAYRLWRPETAPPGVTEEARLVVDRGVVYEPAQPVYQPTSQPAAAPRRGFLGRAFANYPILTTAALLGAGIGSGIAIGSSSSTTPATP
jgi:hypothetical protein